MTSVIVLLSSYNGSAYLIEQLESIRNQKNVSVECLIRDDGSNDTTTAILNDYCKRFSNFRYTKGENIGYKRSFDTLIRHAGDSEYYAFSDQDDIWKEDKLFKAIEKIEKINKPCLYYSTADKINNDKELLKKDSGMAFPINDLMILTQNFCQGCTMVLNKSLHDLIIRYEPKNIYAHDTWIPIISYYFGRIYFDTHSYILYRIHDDNEEGNVNRGFLEQLKKSNRAWKDGENLFSYAEDLLLGYSGILSEDKKKNIEFIISSKKSLKNRFKLMCNKNVRKYTLKGTIFLKMNILFYCNNKRIR